MIYNKRIKLYLARYLPALISYININSSVYTSPEAHKLILDTECANMTSIRPLSPELQERAKKELNEDPNRIAEDIQHIKTWLQKQPHLNARTDDQWILSFLRGCKFSLERTKEKFDMFYAMRTLAPEFYGNRDPLQPDIQDFLKMGMALPLGDLTPDGRKVVLFRSTLYNPEKMNTDFIVKVNNIFYDILLAEDDAFTVAGSYNIIDLQHLKMSQIIQLTPTQMKKMAVLTTKAFPIRPKGIYFINAPAIFETVNKMMMLFLPEKIKARVRVIPKENFEELYNYIPKELLPPEYGGSGKSVAELTEYWKNEVESYKDWLLEDSKFGTNERKRRGRPKTTEDIFGLEGSFRQLNVD